MKNTMVIEWTGEAGWNPAIGNVEKGMRVTVPTDIGQNLIEQGRAKQVAKVTKKGGK